MSDENRWSSYTCTNIFVSRVNPNGLTCPHTGPTHALSLAPSSFISRHIDHPIHLTLSTLIIRVYLMRDTYVTRLYLLKIIFVPTQPLKPVLICFIVWPVYWSYDRMVTVSMGKHWHGSPCTEANYVTTWNEMPRTPYYVVQAQYQREPCLHLVVVQRIFTRGGPINPYLLHHTYLHTSLAIVPTDHHRESEIKFPT